MDLIESIIAKCRESATLFRFVPFETSTPKGRTRERYRRVLLTGMGSGAAKVISLISTLVTVPITLKYLGIERYGLWMTISSFAIVLAFADLGMANGLLNALSDANGKNNRQQAKENVSSAFFMLTGIALFCGALSALAGPLVPWARLLKTSPFTAEVAPSLAAFLICFLIGLPLGVVPRVLMGYQNGFQASIWQGCGSLLGMIAVLLAVRMQSSLSGLVLAALGTPVLVMFLQGIILFSFEYRWLRPSWNSVSRVTTLKLVRAGSLFFLLQMAVSIAYSTDNIVAARVLGAAAVSEYSIAMKLFTIPSVLFSTVALPLWPAYGEAKARGDIGWIKRTLARSLVAAFLVASLPSFVFVWWGQPIIKAWVGPRVVPSFALLLGLGIWTVISAMGIALAMFLNGVGIIGAQTFLGLLMAIGAFMAKVMMARSMGTPGIIWGTILAYTFINAIPLSIYSVGLLRRLGHIPAVACREVLGPQAP